MRSLVPRLVNEQPPAMSTSLFCRLSKSKTRSATVLVDELDPRRTLGASERSLVRDHDAGTLRRKPAALLSFDVLHSHSASSTHSAPRVFNAQMGGHGLSDQPTSVLCSTSQKADRTIC
jgi:hypothetical protein